MRLRLTKHQGQGSTDCVLTATALSQIQLFYGDDYCEIDLTTSIHVRLLHYCTRAYRLTLVVELRAFLSRAQGLFVDPRI